MVTRSLYVRNSREESAIDASTLTPVMSKNRNDSQVLESGPLDAGQIEENTIGDVITDSRRAIAKTPGVGFRWREEISGLTDDGAVYHDLLHFLHGSPSPVA